MGLDPEIMRLRAKWDQVEAMVADAEREGPELPGARHGLAVAKEMLDHAERLLEIEEQYPE